MDSLHLNYFHKSKLYETGVASCICNEFANIMKHYLETAVFDKGINFRMTNSAFFCRSCAPAHLNYSQILNLQNLKTNTFYTIYYT